MELAGTKVEELLLRAEQSREELELEAEGGSGTRIWYEYTCNYKKWPKRPAGQKAKKVHLVWSAFLCPISRTATCNEYQYCNCSAVDSEYRYMIGMKTSLQ